MTLSRNAIDLLTKRYAHKGESPEGIFKRVARAISVRDEKFEKELYSAMVEGIFLPNSPTIRNAGKKRGCLSACFVLPIEDSINSIFETIKNMSLIFQKGGGVGINFSALRPKDAPLSGGGSSSGSISFMQIFDQVIKTVKQGGWRRGASLGALDYNHPDIFDFCTAKLKGDLTNFNLSVTITDEFMTKAIRNKSIELVHGGKTYTTIKAKDILDIIAYGSWISGDPGILFLDRINKDNKLIDHFTIKCCNPCGEQPLPEFGSCCLGSINISKFVEGNNFNFDKFYDYVKFAGRALLNINTINSYPIPQIGKVMGDLGNIGIGIMGFSDALIMLGIKYDSNECLNFIDKLSKPYVQASNEIAPDSFYKRSIAPTGSLSILADCSSSIEPIFSEVFERHLTVGVIEETKDIYKSEFCRTAHQISSEWHLKVQAKFQSFIDSGVSKTINCPASTSVDDIKNIYIQAWKLGVKGVTVFRDKSIEGVLKPINKCEGEVCHL